MRAAGAQWRRRACGAHPIRYHGPLQLLVRRLARRLDWLHLVAPENNLPNFDCLASFSDEFKGDVHGNVAVEGPEEELAARVPEYALSGHSRLARVVAVKTKATEP